ncbi:uroporphyrinogen decarboxylase [Futiania mangrovi]|uniref:Uroporphyrinogen decarboxylase n=1 Tax=Futiania mangrovi TaxID=2959716 RepID=A0A9J6PD31_9PROT|nr:uroporphyrinogen decarboxylase [Futiania mangrovii]MCP1336497.1 uroporphyrinogen decarboxylase [Futiania mangrovii]
MSRSTEKPLLRALSGEALPTPPVWLMRQAGRYLPEYRKVRAEARDFLDLCYSPDLATEVTLQPIRRYGFDASILFADILLIPDALGQQVRFVAGEGPRLEPVRDAAAIGKLSAARVGEHMQPVYETVRRLRRELPGQVTLIGFAGSPWTVATYMVEGRGSPDQKQARLMAWTAPDVFGVLIDKLVAATVEYLSGQVAAGAEVLQLFDSWAQGFSPAMFERWVIAPTRAIVDEIRARHPGVPIIGFPRLAGAQIPHYVAATGVDAVSLDTGVDPAWARQVMPESVCLQGNLDPLCLVAGGEAMAAETRRLLDGMAGRAHVFNLGHGIVPETPPEHVSALLEIVRGR